MTNAPQNTRKSKEPVPLWNPTWAVNLSLLFTPAFGAYLHAKNWKALGKDPLASVNRVFFVWALLGIIFDILALYMILSVGNKSLGIALVYSHVPLLFLWYFAVARMQIKYVRERFPDGFPKRSLVKPLALGSSGLALVLLIQWSMLRAFPPNANTPAAPVFRPAIARAPALPAPTIQPPAPRRPVSEENVRSMKQAKDKLNPLTPKPPQPPRQNQNPRPMEIPPEPDDVLRLIAALENTTFVLEKNRIIDQLSATNDPRAIRPITRTLAECYPKAEEALVPFGEAAEDVVLDELARATEDEYVRRLADCLGTVGTKRSLPVLEKLQNHPYNWAQVAAQFSIGEIQARLGP